MDLSHLPAQEQKKYLLRPEKDYAEFERLREQACPLVPPGVYLWPGTQRLRPAGSGEPSPCLRLAYHEEPAPALLRLNTR